MNQDLYAVIAYSMRYWFLFLAALAVYASLMRIRRDAAARRRVLAGLPDAGLIGEWAVLDTQDNAVQLLEAPPDGWLGGGRMCDVRVRGLPGLLARFSLEPDGLHVVPLRPGKMRVDGQAVRHTAVLRHGATLSANGVKLQLRLFAGVLLEGETPKAPSPGGEGGVPFS